MGFSSCKKEMYPPWLLFRKLVIVNSFSAPFKWCIDLFKTKWASCQLYKQGYLSQGLGAISLNIKEVRTLFSLSLSISCLFLWNGLFLIPSCIQFLLSDLRKNLLSFLLCFIDKHSVTSTVVEFENSNNLIEKEKISLCVWNTEPVSKVQKNNQKHLGISLKLFSSFSIT